MLGVVSPRRELSSGRTRRSHSRMSRAGSPALRRLQGPPGRREREADDEAANEEPSSARSRVRDGERHPGLRDDDALRGARQNVGPWPVRVGRSGSLPLRAIAPATAGVLRFAKEGNAVGVRQAHAPAERAHALTSGTRPSLGPKTRARRSSHLPRARARGGDAFWSVSRSGKPAQAGGTGTGVGTNGRMRGSPRATALAREPA